MFATNESNTFVITMTCTGHGEVAQHLWDATTAERIWTTETRYASDQTCFPSFSADGQSAGFCVFDEEEDKWKIIQVSCSAESSKTTIVEVLKPITSRNDGIIRAFALANNAERIVLAAPIRDLDRYIRRPKNTIQDLGYVRSKTHDEGVHLCYTHDSRYIFYIFLHPPTGLGKITHSDRRMLNIHCYSTNDHAAANGGFTKIDPTISAPVDCYESPAVVYGNGQEYLALDVTFSRPVRLQGESSATRRKWIEVSTLGALKVIHATNRNSREEPMIVTTGSIQSHVRNPVASQNHRYDSMRYISEI
jgi:hypothetical protein